MEQNILIILSMCLVNVTLALSFSNENNSDSTVDAVSKNTLDIKTKFKMDIKNAIIEIIRQRSASKRVKRAAGEGKFAEAAKTSQLKVVQQLMYMFRNAFSSDTIGGKHPLHPSVPYGVVYLFKTSILDVMMPEVGKTYEETA